MSSCWLVLFVSVASLSGLSGQTPSDKPNFAGRWVFERPPAIAIPSGAPATTINPADELIVTQNVAVLTVGHPSRPGSHPYAGAHFFGSRGNVAPGTTYRSSVLWFGRELVIESTIETTGTDGSRNVANSNEKWSLENDGRLLITIAEERSGKETSTETLVYRKR